MRKEYCVYKHTCIANGKIYIGITRKDPKVRWLGGSGYANNKHFYRAIKKYGWNKGFIHEILFEKLSKDEAEKKEQDLIAFYKSNQKEYGYNLQSGGSVNYTLSKEGRENISRAKKGQKINFNYNKAKEKRVPIVQLTLEGKFLKFWDGVSAVQEELGVDCSCIAKCLKKTSSKRRTAYKSIWMYVEDYIDWNGDLSYYQTNKTDLYIGKPVIQLNKTGEIIEVFKSGKEAERKTGIKAQNINIACQNSGRTAGGYIWKYA